MTDSDSPRWPLGMPPGSIRGLLSLQIVITLWLLLMVPKENSVPVPLNIYFLLSLVMVFIVSHGHSIAKKADPTPSPLWLPGGSLRVIILGGTIAIIGYLAWYFPDRLDRLSPDPDNIHNWKWYLACLAGGFTLGYLIRIFPFRHGWGFQSFQAWLSMIAMFTLLIETVLQVFVKSSLLEKIDFVSWQCAVTAIVACYFGTRS